MARGYPKFLFSNPKNTKDEGPFVVHTVPPHFIAKLNVHKGKVAGHQIMVWDSSVFNPDLDKAVQRMDSWLKAQIKNGEIELS